MNNDSLHNPPPDAPDEAGAARRLWSAAEIAVTGVQLGRPADRIVQQLHEAGLDEPQAQQLIRYARDVERLSTAGAVAAEGVRLGRSSAQIVEMLAQSGIDQRVAAGIEQRIRQRHRQSRIHTAARLMVSGVAMLTIAAVVPMFREPSRGMTPALWIVLAAGTGQAALGWYLWQKARGFTDPPMSQNRSS